MSTVPQPLPSPLPDGRLPAPPALRLLQDFLNTKDVLEGRDDLAAPQALANWLASRGLIAPAVEVTDSDQQYVVRVREAVRMFLSRDQGRLSEMEVALLDEVGRRARVQWTFGAEGTVELVARGQGVIGAIGSVLAPILSAALTGSLERLKTCRSCRWVFYDYSKNRSGTWCSMAVCGSRAKARRHYWRTRERRTGEDPSYSGGLSAAPHPGRGD